MGKRCPSPRTDTSDTQTTMLKVQVKTETRDFWEPTWLGSARMQAGQTVGIT